MIGTPSSPRPQRAYVEPARAPLVQLRRGPNAPAAEVAWPEDGVGRALVRAIGDPTRVLTRPLDRVAYASDASLYRLVPRAVVQPASEADVRALFAFSHAQGIPLTFRAAGTSLSGQAVTDGVLVDVSKHWSRASVLDGGRRVRVQPGVIGGDVNARLRRYGRRIGPDPASIDTCMMGGILANNSSGMCCGIRENAYHTLDSIRFVLPSGLVVDTASRDAGALLREKAPDVVHRLLALKRRIEDDPRLVTRILSKYRIKNTTGYALNALLDFTEPEQILAHLLIGSEGTLAFISEAVLRTLPEYRVKRTGLLLFGSAADAFAAVEPMARSGARAIELMDDTCLRVMQGEPALGVDPRALPEGAAALLVEYQCETGAELGDLRAAEADALSSIHPLFPPRFTEDADARAALWKLRKGLFPAVGATKRPGETVIIEDVAFPLPRLPQATKELRALLVEHGYDRGILFGHAKDGNCHFVITQGFNDEKEVARYERFMAAVVDLVVAHDGSLKAEHGTGRNMAPFVEAEWGRDAAAAMHEIKAILDPRHLLNPGVVLNADPRAHVLHLKGLPAIEEEVDRCIECGFCEPVCPSRRLTLTPRQRIVVRREMARLAAEGDTVTRASLVRDYEYAGLDTCAADGMCQTACPVKIDTGTLVKRLRTEGQSPRARTLARGLAAHFGLVERLARLSVRISHSIEFLLGVRFLVALTQVAEWALGVRLPKWSRAIPGVPRRAPAAGEKEGAEAVYVPSCLARIMGRPRGARRSSPEILRALADRARVPLWIPEESQGECCGLPWGSKGFPEEHAKVLGRLVDRMWTWSREGALPIVLDATSCLHGMKAGAAQLLDGETRRRLLALRLVDATEFTRDTLLPRLEIRPLERHVVLHPTCAARKLGLSDAMRDLAVRCASSVDVPDHLGCCAMAGDRGLLYPELTESAVAPEREEVLAGGEGGFYSNNLACEIGMSQSTGVPYESILYLVEEASRPR